MINSVTVTNYLGESITMELRFPEKSGFLIRNIDGLGPPKANIEMTDMALMDGAFYNSARVGSRNIVFSLLFEWTDIDYVPESPEKMFTIEDPIQYESEKEETLEKLKDEEPVEVQGLMLEIETPLTTPSIEATRQNCYKYFPIKKPVRLVFETDLRSCETIGYVESNDPAIFSNKAGAVVSIRCEDSYLFDTETQVTIYDAIESFFEFPFGNESLTENLIEFAALQSDPIKSIHYEGDAEVGIEIYIHAVGDIGDIEIARLDSSKSLEILSSRILESTGESIHWGDDIVVSTVRGHKYAKLIRDLEEINILNCLNQHPDWFTLEKGDNVFVYSATSGEEYIQCRIENKIAYEGI